MASNDITPAAAIMLAGSRRKLGELLSTDGKAPTRQAICNWLRAGKMPPARVLALMRVKPGWFRKQKAGV